MTLCGFLQKTKNKKKTTPLHEFNFFLFESYSIVDDENDSKTISILKDLSIRSMYLNFKVDHPW